MASDLRQDWYTITLCVCLWFWSLSVVRSYEIWIMLFLWLGFVADDFRQAQHTLDLLVSELAHFVCCETELCLLYDLSVTNNDFEHACYALPHYILP